MFLYIHLMNQFMKSHEVWSFLFLFNRWEIGTKITQTLGLVAHAYNPCTLKAEAGVSQIWVMLRQISEILSQNKRGWAIVQSKRLWVQYLLKFIKIANNWVFVLPHCQTGLQLLGSGEHSCPPHPSNWDCVAMTRTVCLKAVWSVTLVGGGTGNHT